MRRSRGKESSSSSSSRLSSPWIAKRCPDRFTRGVTEPESVPGPDTKKAEGRPTGAVLPGFEDYPLTRQECISALVHFYRGEMYRSQVRRTRLDTTTNWAVVGTAAMITFTFGEAVHPHIILLLSNLVIAIFLCQEARRFRYFKGLEQDLAHRKI